MRRGRLLALVLLLLGVPRPSAADWASDEAYIKRLTEHVNELQRTAALFERQRRSLELVKFEFASLELPLADPVNSPEQIVRKLLAKSFPQVTVAMTRLPTEAPPNVKVWKWRCTVSGAVEEIRWATQLLMQKGLFVLPTPGEPVTLELDERQHHGTLTFVGHHVRLDEVPPPKLPQMPTGPDLMASRIDPLAQEVRRLRGELQALRKRVQDILTFEARVESMRFVIKHLKSLTMGGRDPFRVFTPILDLELVRFERLVHTGAEVKLHADVPSEGARVAAEKWLRKQRRRKLRPRFAEVSAMITPSEKEAQPPDGRACGALAAPRRASRSAQLVPLALLRPEALIKCARSPRAMVIGPSGGQFVVKRGMRLGRGRSLVTRIDRRGVTVRWSEGGIKAPVLLPFGALRRWPKPTLAPAAAKGR